VLADLRVQEAEEGAGDVADVVDSKTFTTTYMPFLRIRQGRLSRCML